MITRRRITTLAIIILGILYNFTLASFASDSNPADNKQYYLKGYGHYSQGNFKQAVDSLEKSIALNPDFAKAYFWLGKTYIRLLDFAKAKRSFIEALKVDPNYSEAKLLLELIDSPDFYNQQGYEYYSRGDYDQAIAFYEKALELDPNFTKARDMLEWSYIKKSEIGQSDIGEISREAKDLYKRYYKLGYQSYSRRDYEKATEYYKKSAQLKPDFSKAHYWLGRTYREMGRYQEALEEFKEALRLDADSAEEISAWPFEYIATLFHQSQYEEAIRWIEEISEVDIRSLYIAKKAHLWLGRIALKTGDYRKAEAELTSALEADPYDNDIYNALSRYLYEAGDSAYTKGDYQRASEIYRKQIRGSSRLIKAHYWLTKSLLADKRYKEARVALQELNSLIAEGQKGFSPIQKDILDKAGEGELEKLLNSLLDVEEGKLPSSKVLVGSRPTGLIVHPYERDGSSPDEVYVADYGGRRISVVDIITNTITNIIKVGEMPYSLALSPDGKWLYVTNYGGDSVSVIDVETGIVDNTIRVGYYPTGIAVKPDGSKIYVANYSSDFISVISANEATINKVAEREIKVGYYIQDLEITPEGGKLYASNYYSDRIWVIDTERDQVIGSVNTIGDPYNLAISSDGRYLYATNINDDRISIIDTQADEVIGTIRTRGIPCGIATSPDDRYIYSTSISEDKLMIIDTRRRRVIRTVPVGRDPLEVAITPDGRYVYVSDSKDNTLSVVKVR